METKEFKILIIDITGDTWEIFLKGSSRYYHETIMKLFHIYDKEGLVLDDKYGTRHFFNTSNIIKVEARYQ